MLVKLDDPTMFSKAIELISELVTEVRLKVNEFGMSITAMDPANVSMIGFKIPRSAFTQFEVGKEELGINLENLKKVLKRCGTKSSLILEKKENMLNILIEDCAVVSDACSFIIENGKFIIESKGLNSARAEFSDDSTITGENCKSRYSLEYLSKFVKGSKLCDKTVLNFSQNNLLKIILLNLCLSE